MTRVTEVKAGLQWSRFQAVQEQYFLWEMADPFANLLQAHRKITQYEWQALYYLFN